MAVDETRKYITQHCDLLLADFLCDGDDERFLYLLKDDDDTRDQILESPELLRMLADPSNRGLPTILRQYVGIRRAFLAHGIRSKDAADYTARVVCHLSTRMSWKGSEPWCFPRDYLGKLMVRMHQSVLSGDVLSLRLTLANYLMYITGMRPDIVDAHVDRGDPGHQIYDGICSDNFRLSADNPLASTTPDHQKLYAYLGDRVPKIRVALNEFMTTPYV